MPYFHCHLFALVDSAIDLAHRSRSDGFRLKLIKDLLNLLAIGVSEVLLGGLKGMCGCFFSEVLKLGS